MSMTATQNIVISGMGIVSSNASDLASFSENLRTNTQMISRVSLPEDHFCASYTLANDDFFKLTETYCETQEMLNRSRNLAARRSTAEKAVMTATLEACYNSGLLTEQTQDEREKFKETTLIVAGNNLQSRLEYETTRDFVVNGAYISPTYCLRHYDASMVGLLSEMIGITGEGLTVGATSASGNLALIEGMRKIRHGYCDICIVVGAVSTLSPIDLIAFNNIGALAGFDFEGEISQINRPFDDKHAGFVPGEAAACIILESDKSAQLRGICPSISLCGGAIQLDANSRANPNVEGEMRAMIKALQDAGIKPDQLSYINSHGTGSVLGDETEIKATLNVLGEQAQSILVNATKSITGHCLASAGIVEVIASCIQLSNKFAHGQPNLDQPISDDLNFTRLTIDPFEAEFCMSTSYAFGGINTAIVLKNTCI